MRKLNVLLLTTVLMSFSAPLSTAHAAQDETPATAQEVESLVHEARRGNANAQYRLGRAYETGKGTRQSYTEAARWYSQAANQGLARAQFNLALLYEEGRGVKRDLSYALSWYEEAARNGLKTAVERLNAVTSN